MARKPVVHLGGISALCQVRVPLETTVTLADSTCRRCLRLWCAMLLFGIDPKTVMGYSSS